MSTELERLLSKLDNLELWPVVSKDCPFSQRRFGSLEFKDNGNWKTNINRRSAGSVVKKKRKTTRTNLERRQRILEFAFIYRPFSSSMGDGRSRGDVSLSFTIITLWCCCVLFYYAMNFYCSVRTFLLLLEKKGDDDDDEKKISSSSFFPLLSAAEKRAEKRARHGTERSGVELEIRGGWSFQKMERLKRK